MLAPAGLRPIDAIPTAVELIPLGVGAAIVITGSVPNPTPASVILYLITP